MATISILSKNLRWGTSLQVFDSILTLLTFAVMLVAPVVMTRHVRRNFHRIHLTSFKQNYLALVEDISVKNRSSAFHIMIFCYRRLLQVTLIYQLSSYFYFQI